ncbi:response regulator [bacterium]|nr:response regulator [bacterium]
MSILVVEDDQITGRILELNLKKHGYEVKKTENGRDALDLLKTTLGIELIVADIMMPEMSGIELLEKIKASPKYEKIPVIMCSALHDAENVKKAVSIGCSSYLVKPVNAGILIQKVREVLGDSGMVLQNKDQVMLRTNMDEDAYRTVAVSYYEFIKGLIRDIEEFLNNKTGSFTVDFKRLRAGAKVLGAAFIQARIKQMGGISDNGERDISEREQAILLRELQEFCAAFEERYEAYLKVQEDSVITSDSEFASDRRTG